MVRPSQRAELYRSEGRHFKLKLVRKLRTVYVQLAIVARLAKARETRKNSRQCKLHLEYRYVYFLY
jgi:hypothetical protein